jgi:DeoR/GlpR family transcriptional regulator of sugar metabolism
VLAPPQAVLGAATPLTNGAFQFIVNGQTGLRYVIEASTDFTNWTAITTSFPVGGKITVTDTNAVVLPYRFYRARQQP